MDKLKKSELISLYNGIHSVMDMPGVTFGYCCNINLKRIQPEIDSLQKALTPSEKFLEYDKKRIDIVHKYAGKYAEDFTTLEDGKTVTYKKGEFILIEQNGKKSFDVNGKESVIEEEVEPLKEEYKQAIDEYEKQMTEYNKLLEEECNVELYKVKLENVPKEMTGKQQAQVFSIIEE